MLALQAVPQTGTPRFPSCSRTSGALGASREGLGNTVPGTQVALACHMGRREQVWGLEAFVPAPASSCFHGHCCLCHAARLPTPSGEERGVCEALWGDGPLISLPPSGSLDCDVTTV